MDPILSYAVMSENSRELYQHSTSLRALQPIIARYDNGHAPVVLYNSRAALRNDDHAAGHDVVPTQGKREATIEGYIATVKWTRDLMRDMIMEESVFSILHSLANSAAAITDAIDFASAIASVDFVTAAEKQTVAWNETAMLEKNGLNDVIGLRPQQITAAIQKYMALNGMNYVDGKNKRYCVLLPMVAEMYFTFSDYNAATFTNLTDAFGNQVFVKHFLNVDLIYYPDEIFVQTGNYEEDIDNLGHPGYYAYLLTQDAILKTFTSNSMAALGNGGLRIIEYQPEETFGKKIMATYETGSMAPYPEKIIKIAFRLNK